MIAHVRREDIGLRDDPVEAVADAVDSGDPEWQCLEGLELLTKPAHVDVDRLSLAEELRVPRRGG